MTPEQILADLRDIHLPELDAGAASTNLVLWPLMLVLMAALLLAWLIWRRRSVWRRELLQALHQIEHVATQSGGNEGWTKLAVLLRRLAIQRQGRHDVARLSGEPWLEQLDALVGSDLFTKGPGRGLITFPYLGNDHPDDDTSRRMHEDLKATIETLRSQLPRHGTAG